MSELYLVRHAQASFGEENYDQLSALGHQQSEWLGEYFSYRGVKFDRVFVGEMVRHQETFEGIVRGLGNSGSTALASPETLPQWNEFDFEQLVSAYLADYPEEIPESDAPRLELFQVLKKALHAWSRDEISGNLSERWVDFERRVDEGLSRVTGTEDSGETTLVISSGGAISMAIRQVLGAPADAMIRLNLQTRNSSFSHMYFNPGGVHLSGFNHIPHLDHPERLEAVTYY